MYFTMHNNSSSQGMFDLQHCWLILLFIAVAGDVSDSKLVPITVYVLCVKSLSRVEINF